MFMRNLSLGRLIKYETVMADLPVPVGPTNNKGSFCSIDFPRKNRWQAVSLVDIINSLIYNDRNLLITAKVLRTNLLYMPSIRRLATSMLKFVTKMDLGHFLKPTRYFRGPAVLLVSYLSS